MTSFLPLKNLCTADGHIGHAGLFNNRRRHREGEGHATGRLLTKSPSPPLLPSAEGFSLLAILPHAHSRPRSRKSLFPAVQGDDLSMGTFKGQRGWAFKAEFKLRLRRPVFDPFLLSFPQRERGRAELIFPSYSVAF